MRLGGNDAIKLPDRRKRHGAVTADHVDVHKPAETGDSPPQQLYTLTLSRPIQALPEKFTIVDTSFRSRQ